MLRTVHTARLDLLSVLVFDNIAIPVDNRISAKQSSGHRGGTVIPRMGSSRRLAAVDGTRPIVVSAHVIHDEASLLAARAIIVGKHTTLVPVDGLTSAGPGCHATCVRWVDSLPVSASHCSLLLRISCLLDDESDVEDWTNSGLRRSAELVVVYSFELEGHSVRMTWLKYLRELQLAVTSGGHLEDIPVPSTAGVVGFAQQTFRRGPVFGDEILPGKPHLVPLLNFVLEACVKENPSGSSYACDTPVAYTLVQHQPDNSDAALSLPATPSAITGLREELQYLAFSIACMSRSLPFADEEPMASYALAASALAEQISEGTDSVRLLRRARALHTQLREAHALHAFWLHARQMQLDEPDTDTWHTDQDWTHGLAPHSSVRVVEGASVAVDARTPVVRLRAESGYTIVGWRVVREAGDGQWRKVSRAVVLAAEGTLEFRPGAGQPSRWTVTPYVVHRGMPLHPVHQLFLRHWRIRDDEECS